MNYNRYKRLREQVSTNGGITWTDTGVYKKGDLIDTGGWDSKEDCEIGYYAPYSILYTTNELENNAEFVFNNLHTVIKAQPNKVNELATFYAVNGITSLIGFCNNITNLTEFNFVGEWDCTNLRFMTSMFKGCENLKAIKGIEKLNIENATDMGSMFWGCTSLTELDLSSWNTPKLTDVGYMFYGCSNLEKVDLSNLNTENVTETRMTNMFDGCSNLKTIKGTENFKTKNAASMSSLFNRCESLIELDLSNFTTESLTSVSFMFRGCSRLERLDLSKFDMTNVSNSISAYYMFNGCTSLNYIKCPQSFKDWCERHIGNIFYDNIYLDNFDSIQWDIVK